MNEVHIDCAFVVEKGGKESKSFLVVLMRRRSFSMAGKACQTEFPAKRFTAYFAEMGRCGQTRPSTSDQGLGERNRLGQGTWNLPLERPPATGLQVGRSNQLKAKFAW